MASAMPLCISGRACAVGLPIPGQPQQPHVDLRLARLLLVLAEADHVAVVGDGFRSRRSYSV